MLKEWDLLSRIKKGERLTLRDDELDFWWLLDIARVMRRSKCRLRFIDLGKLDFVQLEWLAEEGVELYSSREARKKSDELELVNKAARRGGGFVAYFYRGLSNSEEESFSEVFEELNKLSRCGIYLYLSSKKKRFEFSLLNELAYGCREGGSWMVYYHHQPLCADLIELGRNGAWIHVRERNMEQDEDWLLVQDVSRASRKEGGGVVFHVEMAEDVALLRELMEAGVFLIFRSLLVDYRSALRNLIEEARTKKLDFRSYYLYPFFLS